MKYRIELAGFGGEISVGTLPQEFVDYLEDQGLDIEEVADDYDNDLEIPEDVLPWSPGCSYDCDNLAHAFGAEMCDSSTVTVYDENDDVVYEDTLNDRIGKDAQPFNIYPDDDLPSVDLYDCDEDDRGKTAYVRQTAEKGLFFGGELEIEEEFDPKKLNIVYRDIDGWALATRVLYGNPDDAYIEVEDEMGGDTNTKGVYHRLTVMGED